MSTADHAGRQVRPSASSAGGSARRAPYADGGTSGGQAQDRGDGSALRRMADADTAPGSPAPPSQSGAPTAPVPVNRSGGTPADAPSVPASQAPTAPPPPAAATPAAPTAAAAEAPRPAARPASARRVRLTVSRIDPWSMMKISFLLSVALGIAGVVMVFVLWTILAGMGVFDQINGIVGQVVQDGQQRFDIMDFVGLGRVLSLSIVIAVIDVILVTAIATLAAFLYNVSSALVGGVQLTLTDD
ncbi:hypothetical protein GCM10023168_26820 [Fodinibacter luteus]|uniref:DUF3566 domain-containing protein n=1 Tax=Fodinibacter luteus TaxID=552064 RepID=A0ABP8KL46_9MICO